MDPRNDDLRAMAGLKSAADESLLRKIQTAKFVYWAESILLAGVVAVTVWVGNNDRRIGDFRRDIGDLRRDVDVNTKVMEKMQPRVDEMWWMKEAGITNGDLKRTQQPRTSATPDH